MTMIKGMPFITGRPVDNSGLLSRFLPPVPEGIVSKWAAENVEAGSWILDPFGTSPEFCLELARSGYHVLISANNPIARFLLDLGANPPNEDELRSALAELASTRVAEERLEIHLQQLYRSICSQCGQPVIAQAFIWDWETDAPYAKIYECRSCGESGEHPVVQSDIELAKSFSTSPLHRMRVLERITPPGDSERANVEEALSVYLPRAIYALVTLVNRLDSLLVSSRQDSSNQSKRDKCLIALVLSALDVGNNLWSYPSGRPRPKQLSSSPQFIEQNLWLALEEVVETLTSDLKPVEFSIYPNLPSSSSGITLYEGRLRELIDDLSHPNSSNRIEFGAVATVIPRYNQAFWTFSALWAGWIWGQEGIGSFRSVLRRRRYDWSWHCGALHSAFSSIVDLLPVNIPIIGLIAEAESSFLSATVISAERAGFTLKGIALRDDSKQAQLHWEYTPETKRPFQISAVHYDEDQQRELIVSKVKKQIQERREPTPYLISYAAALLSVAENQFFSKDERISPADEYSRIDQLIENALSPINDFIRYGGGERSPERANLWYQDIGSPANPLADNVEIEVYQLMTDRNLDDLISIDQTICEIFPGLLTPDYKLISSCVDSYSENGSFESGKFRLRVQDEPQRRTLELASTRLMLCDLGERLGFASQGDDPISWIDDNDQAGLVFYISSSAAIGKIIYYSTYPPENSVVVLPGARANLVLRKLRKNSFLNQEYERGWRIIKFRHLRHLLESPSLSRENLETLMALDPLTESPAQLRLL
jgi:hypothetical protein